ncbi:MAG: Na+/H+ antiporter NhaC family protein [Clostridia bacterium]|nr:Na+/H+ antiporter NhaC family protein [Clostridia bacterium]
MSGTFWAFVPALVAIVLALITKQVYLSLFVGIFVGGMFYVGGNPVDAMDTSFQVMSEKVGGNVPILVFLVVLGIFVVLMQKSGGAKSYGEWAQNRIRNKRGALIATAGLGCLIFVDDYFNCLTVGSTMRPVTDKFKVSHSKLAWIIDSTAAPVCIIAPISSWAAAVSGELGGDGLIAFISTIPFNIYAVLTLIMVFVFCIYKIDFGKMKKNEYAADFLDDLNAGETDLPTDEDKSIVANPKGKVRHLVIPVITLIVFCVLGMIYNGGFFHGRNNFIDAFSSCDAGPSLAIGSTFALFVIGAYYMIAKVVSFKDIMESIVQGFKSMTPAILILVFAWTISGIMGAKGGYLDAQQFVQENVAGLSVQWLFPALFFLLACGISFATGTSWGTFGILIAIATTLLGENTSTLAVLTVSATLGGAVFGDHVSPISDTTILASAGGNCNHVDHVKTQLPYASLVAVIAFISYIIGGALIYADLSAVLGGVIMWVVALGLFVGSVFLIKYLEKKKAANNTPETPAENK